MGKNITILSWNLNGIRAAIKKGFSGFLRDEKPDILCLQETKLSDAARLKEDIKFPGYLDLWNPATRPGYSGTAVLINESRLRAAGLDKDVNASRGFGRAEPSFDTRPRARGVQCNETLDDRVQRTANVAPAISDTADVVAFVADDGVVVRDRPSNTTLPVPDPLAAARGLPKAAISEEIRRRWPSAHDRIDGPTE